MDNLIQITAVRTVAIPVADQDAALAFYTDKLGFEKRLDAVGGGQRWVEVAPPGAATTVALVAAGDGAAVGVDTGIRLASVDAAADQDALSERGVDVDDVLRWEGVPPMFSLRDQDDNVLYVVEGS